jgi:hypothetical protein
VFDTFTDAKGQISLQIDYWSSVECDTYIAIVGQQILENKKGELQLECKLLCFRVTRDCHTGANLANHLWTALKMLDIAKKVSSDFTSMSLLPCSQIGWIMTDNASNNNTMMESLEKKFTGWKIPFDRKNQHIQLD